MANNINNKKLSNLIKNDLQDALTNDSRWIREGLQYYFQDYWKWGTKEIWIHTDNAELKKELEENRLRNWARRQEVREQKKKEYEIKYGRTYDTSELDTIKHENRKVRKEELEPEDWQEIIGLIDQILPLREKKYQAKKFEIDTKLASQPGLTYWWGGGKRFYGIDDWGQGWYNFRLIENGQEYTVSVPKEHSDLANFPFDTEGLYIIGGIDHLPIKQRSHWREKKVGLNDKITFTPYEVENNNELPENPEKELDFDFIKNCDACQKDRNNSSTEKWYSIKRYHGQKSKTIHACSHCYKNKEQEYLENYEFIFSFPADDGNILETIKGGKTDCYAGRKGPDGKILQQQNCSHCRPWKKPEIDNEKKRKNENGSREPKRIKGEEMEEIKQKDKKTFDFFIWYFREHNIKKISLINGELVITHNNNNNNNETVSKEQLTNNSEYSVIKNNLQKINKNELTSSELGLGSDTPAKTQKPTNSPSENKYLWLVGGITLGVVVVGILVLVLSKKKKNK